MQPFLWPGQVWSCKQHGSSYSIVAVGILKSFVVACICSPSGHELAGSTQGRRQPTAGEVHVDGKFLLHAPLVQSAIHT